jgi:two-component system chemotaxis response regulator CheY
MKTLVVDDEVVSREILARIMQTFGEAVAAKNGKEALALFELAWENWSPFDVITLDVSMPDMMGTEVLAQIRHREQAKNVPEDKRVKVVMVTARADKHTVLAAIQAGCNEYITKPFQRDVIARKLLSLWKLPDALVETVKAVT